MAASRSIVSVWKRGLAGALVLALGLSIIASIGAEAQQRRQRATPLPAPAPQLKQPPRPIDPTDLLPRETVQADISTRRVAITSSFAGTEIVVFGAVDNSRQASPEAGLYDIVILVTGTSTPIVARKKSRVLGVWLNTDRLQFTSVPSYYSIVSTRPLEDIAPQDVLKAGGIGFANVPMQLVAGAAEARSAEEIKEFRDAIVRLKRRDRLYSQDEFGVAFIGRSLFRAAVDVPANVTVGTFDTRVFLFKNRELLHSYTARLNLEREGFEDLLHGFAHQYPLLYGIATVLMALGSGLLASSLFRKGSH